MLKKLRSWLRYTAPQPKVVLSDFDREMLKQAEGYARGGPVLVAPKNVSRLSSRQNRSRKKVEGSDWVAFDFETANSSPESACAIGIAVIRDGRIAKSFAHLLRPPELNFSEHNVRVHNITLEMVRKAPTLGDLWPALRVHFDGQIVVAHNAAFDVRVLRGSLGAFGLPAPNARFLDTLAVSRKLWRDLPNHKLSTLASHLGINLNHHEAQSDAVACAEIALAALRLQGVSDLDQLARGLAITPRDMRT